MRYCLCFILLFLTACSQNSTSNRYPIKQDRAPSSVPNLNHVKNATPKAESHSRYGNKNYKVLGKHYKVYRDINHFTQEGYASWYGAKFHGHKTSNGEIYDMYKMTAAHTSLPIPSYVKVTNKNNGRSVIVRINDRGPFHSGRIIDLSYVAAYKLDMLKTGTAPVKIELINPKTTPANLNQSNTKPAIKTGKYYVQVITLSHAKKAAQKAQYFRHNYNTQVRIKHSERSKFYRIQLGPFQTKTMAQKIQSQIRRKEGSKAFVLIEN